MQDQHQQAILEKFKKYEQVQQNQAPIKIGYFPFKGRGQILRHICEYLKLKYQNLFFTPNTWQYFKKNQADNWNFKELPFVKDGDLVVTQTLPACLYLVNKYGPKELLGKNIKDQSTVDMFIWSHQMLSSVIAIQCKSMVQCQTYKQKMWSQHVKPRLDKFQKGSKEKDWYLGYLTLIDFNIYGLMSYVKAIFPTESEKYPKLNYICQKFKQLPQISEFQSSDREVSQVCPIKFFEEFKIYMNLHQKP